MLSVRHFHFHWQPDLPETLTRGRKAEYLQSFSDRLTRPPATITPADSELYATFFRQPGAVRAGFDFCRAFHQDAADNRARIRMHGEWMVPLLALSGEESFLAVIVGYQAREMQESVEVATVSWSGHWCTENPEEIVERVLRFVERCSKGYVGYSIPWDVAMSVCGVSWDGRCCVAVLA
ncbi:unnamed protein product [Diplocarpon coronariae]|uniref:Alpha/beta hydrolase fold protein n=1 Tax=Diplocarpon coronariae TaxID=2795749 RepID=A0A218YSS7_9HELO|nr:alpha/beta hydrolase fold protein [Marssonina coronariae]